MVRHARMRGHAALFLPGLDHASIAAQFVLDGILAKEGESRQTLGRERYLERMVAFSDSTKPVMLGQQRRVGGVGRLGPAALHDGRGLGQGRARRLRPAVPRRPGLSDRGPRQLVPRLPDERVRPRGHPDRGDRDAVVGPLPPHRPDDRRADPDRHDHRRHDPARDDPGRHGRGRPSRRPALRGPSSVGRCASRSSSATCRSSPTTSSSATSGPARSRSPRPTTPTTTRPGCATACRRRRSSPTTRRVTGTGTAYDGLDRYEARRASWPTSRPSAATSPASGRTRWSSAAASAATTSSSRGSRPSGSSAWTALAARALDATRSGRTRILPERFEKTWEHWLTDIRDWNVSRQLWWGHRIPAWYCPDGHVTVSAAAGGPDGLRGLRPTRRRPPAGPGHLRHLVQQRAVAVLDPRLAGRHAGPAALLPDLGHGDRLRHHLLLGRPDDDARAAPDRPRSRSTRSTCPGSSATPKARRCPRPRATSSTRSGVIDETGADALRFALIHGAAPGQDQRFGPVKLENARNFANKLWNATRFVVGNAPGVDRRRRRAGDCPTRATSARPSAGCARGRPRPCRPSTRRWPATSSARSTRILYDAIWSEYCDWGVELAKVRLADETLEPATARRPGGRSSRSSTRTCGCSIR